MIGDNPFLLADEHQRSQGVDDIFARVVVEQEGVAPDSLDDDVVGGAVAQCSHNAPVGWARHGQGQPGAAIDAALRRLSAGFASA